MSLGHCVAMTLHDIVVGLDGSDSSVEALRWASGLADAVAAQVRILSTWHMPILATVPSIVVALPPPAFMAAHAGEQIDDACAEAGVTGAPAKIIEGDAGAFLTAETEIADLVVVGRSGSGHRGPAKLLAELVLGSATRYCLHHAQGPVAVIPAHAKWVDHPTVVVGIDGSPSSIAALRWAIEMLPSGSIIKAVQAVPPYLEGMLALDSRAMDKIIAATSSELDETISKAQAGLDRADISITTFVVIENARHALTRPGLDADLIVVGSRSRTTALTPLLGSTSDHAVRHAKCPVVVVPPEKGPTP